MGEFAIVISTKELGRESRLPDFVKYLSDLRSIA